MGFLEHQNCRKKRSPVVPSQREVEAIVSNWARDVFNVAAG